MPQLPPTEPEPWWAARTVVPEELAPLPPSFDPPAVFRPASTGSLAEAAAADVPRPGRHAARRRWPGARIGWPGPVSWEAALGPWHLALTAVVVAVGLAIACWWVVRSDSSAASPLTAAPAAGTSAPALVGLAAPTGTAVSAAPSPGTVTVDVTGKVRRRGVLALPAGSRVIDAVTAAGGARPGVDLSSLNLARVLVDGEQVVVGGPPPAGGAGATGPSAGAAAGTVLVNLNTATAEELDTLPDVGPVTAQSILDWRTEHGGFTAIEELLEVDGIGEATLERLRPHVTV